MLAVLVDNGNLSFKSGESPRTWRAAAQAALLVKLLHNLKHAQAAYTHQQSNAKPQPHMSKDASQDPNSGISRRGVVQAGFGALAAPAMLRIIPANAQSRVMKIGHVSPKTGPLAGFGEADG